MDITSELQLDEITTANGMEQEKASSFIKANTKEVSLNSLKADCTVPVFSKDNECTLAHQEFIESAWDCANRLFRGHQIRDPEIRVSHVIKGRVPSAIGKPVSELKAHEKTIYYERMMFVIEIPTISEQIDGNLLKLTMGGVRAYNHENLYSRKSLEKFKVFIGFKNKVCTNLLVSSDGVASDLRVASRTELKRNIMDLVGQYAIQPHLENLSRFKDHSISEREFAQLIGRLRLYQHAPKQEILDIPPLLLTDSQVNNVVKGFYMNVNHAGKAKEGISLWRLYNLFTGANKRSYIDSFLDRGVQAYAFVQMLQNSKENELPCWYLH